MSSQDSMGIVFKCLSKGAVDFLVKPIRKNELKNLWQHVWRRCHSVSLYTIAKYRHLAESGLLFIRNIIVHKLEDAYPLACKIDVLSYCMFMYNL